MTTTEMSDMFDELANSYSQTPDASKDITAFNEYEKSLFLTQAQEQFVIAAYDGKNNTGNAFEVTEEDRRMLSNLVRSATLTPETDENINCDFVQHIVSGSKFFKLPQNLMFITYESCKLSSDDKCLNNKQIQIVPVTQDEFHKTYKNPFRGTNGNRALRLDIQHNLVEIVSKNEISSYFVRYIERPKPIVLVDLGEDGLSIQGVSYQSDCRLNKLLHERIVRYAVQLALQSRNIKQQ